MRRLREKAALALFGAASYMEDGARVLDVLGRVTWPGTQLPPAQAPGHGLAD